MSYSADYDQLIRQLEQPPVTVWQPARQWHIAHEPPAEDKRLSLLRHIELLLRRISTDNRRRLVTIAVDLAAAEGVQLPDMEDRIQWTVAYRELAYLVERYAVAVSGRYHLPYPFPHQWFGRYLAFRSAWYRAVRYFVPVRLPKIPVPIDRFLDQLPAESRDRWQHEIADHFDELRDTSARRVSVREVSQVSVQTWRDRGIPIGDIEDLVGLMREYGYEPATARQPIASTA